MQPQLTPKELAARLGVSRGTLKRWRREGKGPAWCRVGAQVRFRPEDVASWEQERLQQTTRPTKAPRP